MGHAPVDELIEFDRKCFGLNNKMAPGSKGLMKKGLAPVGSFVNGSLRCGLFVPREGGERGVKDQARNRND